MTTITAIIPSRYASTRFPGKPLALIAGKTLVEWTYANASRCGIFTDVAVATDDNRIADVVTGFGGKVCLTSRSHSSGTDRIAEAAGILGLSDESIVVNIQGDEPLVEHEAVEKLLAPMLDDRSLLMATLSFPICDEAEAADPNIVKVVTDSEGNALYFSRAPIPFSAGRKDGFFKHIGIYAYNRKFLDFFSRLEPSRLEKRENLEQLRALENGIRIRVVESCSDPVEVDVPGDILKVEKALSGR